MSDDLTILPIGHPDKKCPHCWEYWSGHPDKCPSCERDRAWRERDEYHAVNYPINGPE